MKKRLIQIIGGLATLVASARQTARIFADGEFTQDQWRAQLYDIMLHGLVPCPPAK